MQPTELGLESNHKETDQAMLLRSFVEHSPAAIAMFDRNMHYLLASRRWLEDYSLGDRDIIGQSHYDLFPDLPQHWKAVHQRCLAGAIERSDEEAVTNVDGNIDWLKWEVRPWHDPLGAIGGIIVFTELLIEQKQQALSLQQANAALEASIKARNAELEQTVEQLQQEIWERHAALRDREQAARELQESKQLLQLVIDLLPQRVFWKDQSFRYLGCNKLFAQDAQLESPEQLIGKDDFELTWKESAHRYRADDTAVIQNNISRIGYDELQITGDGTMIWVRSSKTPLLDATGAIVGVFGTYEDISDRKEIEAALQKEQVFLKTVLDHLADGIVACDETGQLTLFNRATREFHGITEATLLPDQWAPYFNLYHADGETAMQTQDIPLFRAFEGEIVHNAEMVIAPKQGKTRTLLASGQAFFDHNGSKLGAVVAMHDITAQREREHAEAQLQEQEQFLRSIYDGVICSIFVVDVLENGEYQYASHNHAEAKLMGRLSAEVEGKTPADVFGATEGAVICQFLDCCIATKTALTTEENLTFDGKNTWLMTTFNPLVDRDGHIHRIVGTSFNITDLKQAEAQLKQQAVDLEHALQELQRTQTQMVQSEKMSSLGQLVAGVAHEINNPVNFIHGNIHHASQYIQDLLDLLQLYQSHYSAPTVEIQTLTEDIDLEFLQDDLPKLLVSMKVGADRIREIVASLRSFSRLDEAEVKDVDIHEGIDSTLMILHNRLKSKSDYPAIQIVKEYGNLPQIECYAGQLNQVFMNILSNAIDALDEQNQQRSPADVAAHPSIITIQTKAIGNETVSIQVTDNGPGIPEAVQKRLFDPFFTTKAVGKGTGMGMSISHQVITARHKGRFQCLSLPGQGATFVIEIPIRQAP